jgi:hypothetical protein
VSIIGIPEPKNGTQPNGHDKDTIDPVNRFPIGFHKASLLITRVIWEAPSLEGVYIIFFGNNAVCYA